MSQHTTIARLQTQVAAVCPIDGVSVGVFGQSASVRIDFQAAATPAQRTAAQGVVDTFDWSQAAQAAFDLAQGRMAASALTTATISTNQLAALVRTVVLLILDELNTHSSTVTAILNAVDAATSLVDLKTRIALIADLPQRTKSQLLTAMTNKIAAGAADA